MSQIGAGVKEAAKICDPGGKGWFLPVVESEHEWPDAVKSTLYLIGMAYFFLGISIIADIFMASIEAVTSRKRQVEVEGGRRETQKVWHDTVATLSLMALGSSAPEIFLSVLELFKKEMHTGDLGPSTITGSAAFNLFVIIGVCVYSIPAGEERRIEAYPTFLVTVFFSVGAYMWLVFILVVRTPDMVDPEEGLLTLIALPIMIWSAYSTECGVLSRCVTRFLPTWMVKHNLTAEDKSSRACLGFQLETVQIGRSLQQQSLKLKVLRKGKNYKSAVSCTYRMEPLNAVPNYDFEQAEGQLDFEDGVDEAVITIKLPPHPAIRSNHLFLVVLESEDENACFDDRTDGGDESDICTVTIGTSTSSKRRTSVVHGAAQSTYYNLEAYLNWDRLSYGMDTWKDQFVACAYCGGSPEEQAEAGIKDWIMHFLTLPWNFFFAFVPPTTFCGGWICFTVAIILIGFLTAIVSDLAELFGCVLGLPDIVTAITFVALGTSMPDLFASLSAAADDPVADASVVNVTGSNSVNVFLGLGVPWSIAAIYWRIEGRTDEWLARYPEQAARYPDKAGFVVDSRNLGFSVMAFTGCTFLCLVVLFMRRKYLCLELGGPIPPKIACFVSFVVLWLGFVGLTSWRVLRCVGAKPGHFWKAAVTEQFCVINGAMGIMFLFTLVTAWLTYKHRVDGPLYANSDDGVSIDKEHPLVEGEPVLEGVVEGAAIVDVFLEEDAWKDTSKEFDFEVPNEDMPQLSAVRSPFPTPVRNAAWSNYRETNLCTAERVADFHPRLLRR